MAFKGPHCVFCWEMTRKNPKNAFGADVRPFVGSSVHALSFFGCIFQTEQARATKIGNRLP